MIDRIDRIEQAVLSARDERADGFDAYITISASQVLIDTRISRDPRRCYNGGEYYFWLEVWPDEASGQTLMLEMSSCDFWQPEATPKRLGIGYADVVAMVRKLAAENGVPVVEE